MAKKQQPKTRKPHMPPSKAPVWKAALLQALAISGSVGHSCKVANISRSAANAHKRKDAEFSDAWEDALEDATDSLEAEVMRRARDGVDEPVFYLGQQVATVKKFSDNLAMFMLKARRPELYRDLNLEQLADIIIRRLGTQALPAGVPEGTPKPTP